MFKLQSRYKSIDINKNLEEYKFFPKQRYQKSLSEDKKEQYKEKVFTNSENKKILPIYFYRKISTPYKYNITSIPEYLIKTNEEKRFVDKLYSSINNPKEKALLEDLINKKKLTTRNDYYKPKNLDIHNVLRYKPNLYPYSFSPENKTNLNNLKPQNMKLFTNNENKGNDKYKIDYLNTSPNLENNNSLKKEKKNSEMKIEIPKDKQIKYKYKLSDIFNLHDDSLFTNKSSEKYLYKNNQEQKENRFYTTSESKSDWIPNKINQKKSGANSSVDYNIITPMYKGSNRFITATELNKDNFYNENPSFRRIKSISEFIDLTSVSATNTLDCFNRKNKIPNFKFKNMVATNQADEYYYNRNLVEKSI